VIVTIACGVWAVVWAVQRGLRSKSDRVLVS
jgi:zinc/manganese transport system permease protein